MSSNADAFAILGEATDHVIREIIARCDKPTLAKALLGAPDRIRARFLSNMRSGELRAFSAVMASFGRLPVAEADRAQGEVMQVANDIAARGEFERRDAQATCEPWTDVYIDDAPDPVLISLMLDCIRECALGAIGKPAAEMEAALDRILRYADLGAEKTSREDLPDWISDCAADCAKRLDAG